MTAIIDNTEEMRREGLHPGIIKAECRQAIFRNQQLILCLDPVAAQADGVIAPYCLKHRWRGPLGERFERWHWYPAHVIADVLDGNAGLFEFWRFADDVRSDVERGVQRPIGRI